MSRIYFNNEIIDEDQPVLTVNNRGFLYGDGLFESMRMFNRMIPWIHQHLERLKAGMTYLKLRTDQEIDLEDIFNKISELRELNQTGDNARIRITVTRRGGGRYLPDSKEADIAIQIEPMTGSKLTLNNRGIHLGTFSDSHKTCGELANYKTTSALVYIAASMYCRANHFDDCAVFNAYGHIADTLSSNIFIYANKAVFTPALSEGCVAGVMRRVVIDVLNIENIQVVENFLGVHELEHATEIFTTNAVSGIQWIRKFGSKIYDHRVSDQLIGSINERWKLT